MSWDALRYGYALFSHAVSRRRNVKSLEKEKEERRATMTSGGGGGRSPAKSPLIVIPGPTGCAKSIGPRTHARSISIAARDVQRSASAHHSLNPSFRHFEEMWWGARGGRDLLRSSRKRLDKKTEEIKRANIEEDSSNWNNYREK